MNRNIEVVKLKLNGKTGGLDILYLENVEMKVERHNTTFPHRPIKALVNAIRKLSMHIPFMCEMEKEKTFQEVKEEFWKENELGFFPMDVLGFSAQGFTIKQKDDKFVEIVGEKFLELSSKSMKINTDYFIVTDDSEYDHAQELLKDIVRIQELAAAYIDGEFDKSGTQYDIFASPPQPPTQKEEETNAVLLSEGNEILQLTNRGGHYELSEHQEAGSNEEEKEEPSDLENNEDPDSLIEEDLKSNKKVRKSSNLKPAKKK